MLRLRRPGSYELGPTGRFFMKSGLSVRSQDFCDVNHWGHETPPVTDARALDDLSW